VADYGGGSLDADTYLTGGSFQAAVRVAGAAVKAVEDVMSDRYKFILIAGRPPGHHAEYDRGMGFCIINNSAVAAQAAIEYHGLNRVAIVDWDVHHGNGTQHIFYHRSDVLYISLHQYPFYPGTGLATETGSRDGTGFTLNLPLAAGSGDNIYHGAFRDKVIPRLEEYGPELIVITSGFDAHREDLLGGMSVSEQMFGQMTGMLRQIADRFCSGRMLSFFEGGYNPDANARSLYYHLKGLKGE
jgi:acetoin utilization deacetylase AcuC-like enzyme